jgi:hypothetical protein
MVACFVTFFLLIVLANAVEKNLTDKPVNVTIVPKDKERVNITAGDKDEIIRSKSDRGINKTLLPDSLTDEISKLLDSSLDLCKTLLKVKVDTLPNIDDITRQVEQIDEEDDGDAVMNNTVIRKQIRLLLLVSDIAMFCDFNADLIDANSTVTETRGGGGHMGGMHGFRSGFRRGFHRGFHRGNFGGGFGYGVPFYGGYGYGYPYYGYGYPYYGYGYPYYGYGYTYPYYGYGYPYYGYGGGYGYGYPYYGYGGYGGYGGFRHGFARGHVRGGHHVSHHGGMRGGMLGGGVHVGHH